VLVILLGVQAQILFGKPAFRPGLVKRVLEQVVLFDQSVKRFKQSLRAAGFLGHPVFLTFPRIMAARQNQGILPEFAVKIQYTCLSVS
jgi:hypothetical protein